MEKKGGSLRVYKEVNDLYLLPTFISGGGGTKRLVVSLVQLFEKVWNFWVLVLLDLTHTLPRWSRVLPFLVVSVTRTKTERKHRTSGEEIRLETFTRGERERLSVVYRRTSTRDTPSPSGTTGPTRGRTGS